MADFFKYSKNFEYFFAEHGELVEYQKGQHLVWQKDDNAWMFFLKEGLVRVSFTFSDGSNRILGYFVPGHIFAQSGSFFDDRDGMLSYTAEQPLRVYRMKNKAGFELIQNDPVLMKEYLSMTLRNQIFLIDRVVYQGEKGLYLKCARWLLFMAKYYGQTNGATCEIAVPLTQETAANFLHTTRESLNGVFQQLSTEGHITISTKKIIINDLTRLRQLLT